MVTNMDTGMDTGMNMDMDTEVCQHRLSIIQWGGETASYHCPHRRPHRLHLHYRRLLCRRHQNVHHVHHVRPRICGVG